MKHEPDANASIVSLANAGGALQGSSLLSPQAGLTAFDSGRPFELTTGVWHDDGSAVTLPGDSEE